VSRHDATQDTQMSKLVDRGATAMLAIALIGCQASGSASAGATASAEASVEPSVAAPSSTAGGSLAEGSHLLWSSPVPITVTISDPGWFGERGGGILVKDDSAGAPDGAGMIVFEGTDLFVYGDPCQWSTTRPDTPATTVDELVAALTAQATRDASAPVDVTVDGHDGKSITLHVPEDAEFSACDQGEFGSWGQGSNPRPARYHQDPGQIDKLWIVDVDGQPAILDIAWYEGTPQAVVDDMEAIVESTTFGP
jgi:hypothetical protein